MSTVNKEGHLPIDECRALRGISQSTAFCGVTPGLNFLLILLLLLFLVCMGAPNAVAVEEAGGGGIRPFSEVGLSGSSKTVGSVGFPLYGELGPAEFETGDF